MLVTQWCPTLCSPMDCSPQGSSLHGIFRARILVWIAIPFSSRSSKPRNITQISCSAGRFFTIWAIRVTQLKSYLIPNIKYSKSERPCTNDQERPCVWSCLTQKSPILQKQACSLSLNQLKPEKVKVIWFYLNVLAGGIFYATDCVGFLPLSPILPYYIKSYTW